MDQWSPSADTVGRVCAQMELPELREALYRLYSRFRRNKVLLRPRTELVALILDGHESSASYLRHCSGCLERKKVIAGEERI